MGRKLHVGEEQHTWSDGSALRERSLDRRKVGLAPRVDDSGEVDLYHRKGELTGRNVGEKPLPRGRRTVEQDPFGVNGSDPQRRTPRLDEGTFDASSFLGHAGDVAETEQ